jgi:GDP-4-dehydro-6-deoxy-D-mannose reductase
LRILITGVTGFAGSHLAEHLLGQGGVELYGTYRWRSRMENLDGISDRLNAIDPGVLKVSGLRALFQQDKLNLIGCELTDGVSVRRLLDAVRPDGIFHLAAQSYVPSSWNGPEDTLRVNIFSELNLLEGMRELGLGGRIQIAGSSEEYGLIYPGEVPVREDHPLRPLSPYAVSKVTQEKLAYQYFKSYGIRSILTRGFNHEGPRRGEVFVTSNFARQIAEIEKGHREPVIKVGDLTCERDWTDVRDMVKAYWLALNRCEEGEPYNIGSGVSRTVGEMLQVLLDMSEEKIRVEQDPARLRPSDVRVLCADSSKFRAQTGWEPTIPFHKTMADLLNYWRGRV